jgi:hypothetical protein
MTSNLRALVTLSSEILGLFGSKMAYFGPESAFFTQKPVETHSMVALPSQSSFERRPH